jgi:hypothetical protein
MKRTLEKSTNARHVDAVNKGRSKSAKCFVATAAYGSELAPSVLVLREYRDTFLLRSRTGRAITGFYCLVSSPLAAVVARNKILRQIIRRILLEPLGAYVLGKLVAFNPQMNSTSSLEQYEHDNSRQQGCFATLTEPLEIPQHS